MSFYRNLVVCIGTTIAAGLLSCEQCDREGCELLTEVVRKRADSANLAGVAAARSDVMANGCQECPLGQASLRVWALQEAVTSQAELDAIADRLGAPMKAIGIAQRFEERLPAGAYLVCVGEGPASCHSFALTDDQQATLNVRVGEAAGSFFYSESLSDAPTKVEALSLDV